jgi:group I intron endonuclease
MAYVYRIVRIKTGFCYIGHTSKNPQKRWQAHFDLLCKGKHHSRYLQNAWKKYGAEAFKFEVIEECDEADKLKREQHWIDGLNSCFNTAKVAGSRKGVKFTKIQRELLSKLRMGHATSEETKAKIAAASLSNQRTKGLVWSKEARRNMSKAVKGKPRSAAQRAATLRSLELARRNARVNKPGMNWRLLRQSEGQGNLFE